MMFPTINPFLGATERYQDGWQCVLHASRSFLNPQGPWETSKTRYSEPELVEKTTGTIPYHPSSSLQLALALGTPRADGTWQMWSFEDCIIFRPFVIGKRTVNAIKLCLKIVE